MAEPWEDTIKITKRDPNAIFIPSAQPTRVEQGPPMPERGVLGGVSDWIENQRAVAGTIGYSNPVVAGIRNIYDHWGLQRDESYNPTPDMEGYEFEFDPTFRAKAAFAGSRGEMDLIKRRFKEERENEMIQAQNPIASLGWGLASAPFDPTNLIPGGAVYRAGRLGLGVAASAAAGAAAGAAGGFASELAMQATHYSRTPGDYLTSTAYGAGFGAALGSAGSMLSSILGSSAAQLSKPEFDALARKLETGPAPVTEDTLRASAAYQDTHAQLKAAGMDDQEAGANAAIMAAANDTRAKRLGVSADDLWRSEGPEIRAGEAPDSIDESGLYQFAGERAKTADLQALSFAKGMEARGADHDVIWMTTGWGRGADGKWRFEVPDNAAKLDVKLLWDRLDKNEPVTVRDVYSSPELEAAYPDLFDIPIERLDAPGILGGYDIAANKMELNPDAGTPRTIRSTILHELQHAIQAREGHGRGGSSAWMAYKYKVDADAADDLYRRIPGEVEARTTQARADLTADQRLDRPPWRDEDVPREDQISYFQSAPGDNLTEMFDQTMRRWRDYAQAIIDGKASQQMTVLRRSPVLSTVFGGNGKVTLDPIRANAIRGKHADIPGAVWHLLPRLLADPEFVFTRASGDRLAVLSVTTKDGSPIIVGIRGDGEIQTVTPWGASPSGETGWQRLGRELDYASQRSGRIYAKTAEALEAARNGNGSLTRPNPARRPSTVSTEGFRHPGLSKKIFTQDDVVKAQGGVFYQDDAAAAPRGAITLGESRAVIQLFKDRDASTFMHESAHLWLNQMVKDAEASPQTKADLDKVLEWFGVDDAGKIDVVHHEQWARGFEQYLRDGKAPSSALQRAFDQFREWLTSIYKALTDLGEPIPDDIRGVMNRLLAVEEKRPQEATGGFGGSGGAAYRYEDANRLKSTLGIAEVAGKAPIYGSPIAFAQTSPFAAVRRMAEWIGDGRLAYEKNAEGLATAADDAIGLRGNLDDVKRLSRARHAELTRKIEDLYSQYRFGRDKRMGDNVRRMMPDPAHLDFDAFKAEVWRAANLGDSHAIPEVATAAREFRKVADALADRAVEVGIWNERPAPVGADSYAPHIFNTRLVAAREQEFVADTADFYARDQVTKARLQDRMQEITQQRDAIVQSERKLLARMETLDRRERELAARSKERGMEAGRARARVGELTGQETAAAEDASSLDEFIGAVKAEIANPQARAEIEDLRATAKEMSRLAAPRTKKDMELAARYERDAVLSGLRQAAEIATGRRRPYEAPSFLRWVARKGGVADPSGSLRGSDIPVRGVISARGHSLDELGEAIAEEAGALLNRRPDANEVEDWIAAAARGEDPWWWVAAHVDQEAAAQSRIAGQIQQMATEAGAPLKTLDDVAAFLRGEGTPQTLDDLERRIAEEESLRTEGLTGPQLAEEARQNLDAALSDRAAARRAIDDAKVALAGVRRRMMRAEIKGQEAGRALDANERRMQDLTNRTVDLSVRRQVLEAAIAAGRRQADELRGTSESIVAAWDGRSSKSAKRAIAKREAELPEGAPRLKTADAAVDDAVDAILGARTDLTPDELKARAQETWRRVVGTPAGRFAYDDQASTGSAVSTGKEQLGRTFQERQFAMPFDVKSKWLERDIDYVSRSMIEQMEMDIAIVERFGEIQDVGGLKMIRSDGTTQFKEIVEEAQRQKEAFASLYEAKHGKAPTPAQIEANNRKLTDRANQDIDTLQKMLERQRGMFGVPSDPRGLGHQAANIARGFNIMTSLGSVLVSSISDLATPLMRHGMIELLGSGWAPYVAMTGREIRKRAVSELKLMGVGLELELQGRLTALNDIVDDYGRGSMAERATTWSVNNFMTATGLPQWTDVGERVVGYTAMTKILKAAKAISEGTGKPAHVEMLADLGISPDTAKRIWSSFSADNGGERFGGLWLTNTGAWDDGDAAQAMAIGVGRAVERSIVRPGQERPFWSQSNDVGKLVFQFQSFMTATAQTVLLAGIQQRNARAVMAMAAMIGLGALSYQIRQVLQGREPSDDPKKLVLQGLSASGLLGWLEQVNTVAEKASGGHVGMSALTGEFTSRHVNYGLAGTIGGPVAGKAEDAFTAIQNLSKGQASGYDVNKLRRSFLPGQNYWLLRGSIDDLEDGLSRSLGLKPRKRTLKVGAQ